MAEQSWQQKMEGWTKEIQNINISFGSRHYTRTVLTRLCLKIKSVPSGNSNSFLKIKENVFMLNSLSASNSTQARVFVYVVPKSEESTQIIHLT